MPTFTTGESVFVDKPPPSSKTEAELFSGSPRAMLLPKTTGRFQLISSDGHKVKIREDGIPNTVSIDLVTHDPEKGGAFGTIEEHTDNSNVQEPSGEVSGQSQNVPDRNGAGNAGENVVEAPTDDSVESREYLVEPIVGHTKVHCIIHYVIGWFGYVKDGDSTKPLEQIPEQFIVRYWDKIRHRKRPKEPEQYFSEMQKKAFKVKNVRLFG